MQINNELLKYTILNKNIESSVENQSKINTLTQDKKTVISSSKSTSDVLVVNGQVQDVTGVMSDEEYIKAVSKLKAQTVQTSRLVTKYSDLSQDTVQKIKEAIYNYHNPVVIDTSYYSFIQGDTFMGVDNLVKWLDKKGIWDEQKGLAVKDLIDLTKNDDLEDINQDFFGNLNRAFLSQAAHTEDITHISYEELCALFKNINNNSKGSCSLVDYLAKVDEYSALIQEEFDQMDTQEKLEWSIDRTREYLEYAGLTNQIEALDRMLGEPDAFNTENTIHKGNIALSDLNPDGLEGGMTCGAYTWFPISNTYEKYNGYSVPIWSNDKDDKDAGYEYGDCGITLDIRLVNGANGYNFGHWYDLINTLVHELTHATAYRFYDFENLDSDGVPGINYEELAKVTGYTVNELKNMNKERLYYYYLAYTAWGEYAAYQADADYWDSIGGDLFAGSATSVDGYKEKDSIIDHVQTFYDHPDYDPDYVEALTDDWKWWSYKGIIA